MSYRASAAAVVRMSIVSNGSLNENGMQYMGDFARSGRAPNCASSSAARSRASGCLRNSSQTAGAPAGKGAHRFESRSPLHVTDRSPRRFSVPSALICPEFGVPNGHSVLLLHVGVGRSRFHSSELNRRSGVLDRNPVAASRPRPSQWGSDSGGSRTAVPRASGIGAPSRVTSRSLDAVVHLWRDPTIRLDESAAGDLSLLDCPMHVCDRRLHHLEAARL